MVGDKAEEEKILRSFYVHYSNTPEASSAGGNVSIGDIAEGGDAWASAVDERVKSLYMSIQSEQRRLESTPNPSPEQIRQALQNKKDFTQLLNKVMSLRYPNAVQSGESDQKIGYGRPKDTREKTYHEFTQLDNSKFDVKSGGIKNQTRDPVRPKNFTPADVNKGMIESVIDIDLSVAVDKTSQMEGNTSRVTRYHAD